MQSKLIWRAVLLVTALTSIAASLTAHAVEVEQVPGEGKFLRVGGDYKVTSIDRNEKTNHFLVKFESLQPSGKFDVLNLESDHVHVAVKVGQSVRLSAEILTEAGATAEVAQVVLFFQGQDGRVPIWLMSTKSPAGDLRATSYLKMHVPSTDFLVM